MARIEQGADTDIGGGLSGTRANAAHQAPVGPAEAAPTEATNTGATVFEGGIVTLDAAMLDYVDDLDSAASVHYQITNAPANGTLYLDGVALGVNDGFSQADIAAGLVTFEHDGGETSDDSFGFAVSDNDLDFNTGNSFHFTINPVNDAPEIDLDPNEPGNDAARDWIIGWGPTFLAQNATIFDPDNFMVPGGALTVSIDSGGTSDDQLGLTSIGDDFGQIRVDGGDLYYEGTLVGTVSGGANGTDLHVNFNDGASISAVQRVLSNITFDNTAATPSGDPRTVSFHFTDGSGTDNGGHDSSTTYVTVTTVASTGPTADPVSGSGSEDATYNYISLVLHDEDPNNFSSFQIDSLPDHGTLYDQYGNQIIAATLWPADYYDSGLGAWVLNLYFTPDADWSGVTSFDYFGMDAQNIPSGTATATVTIDAVADTPYLNPGVNDVPQAMSLANPATATTGAEDGPVVVALPGGDTLVVWQSGLSPSFIKAQVFDFYGDPAGPAFNVTTSGGVNELQPAAAAQADGSFAISWIVDGAGTGGGNVVTAFYAAGATTPTTTVTTVASSDVREADTTVTALDDGTYVVTWAIPDGSGSALIEAQRYDATGTEIGTAILVASAGEPGLGTGASFDPPDHGVVDVGNGNFVVVDQNDSGGVDVVLVTGFTSSWVEYASTLGADQLSVGKMADGGFVIAWRQDDGSGGEDIYARTYDSSGHALTAAVAVADGPDAQFTPVVAGLPDGRYVVAWIGNGGVAGSYDIYAQTFAADGTPGYGGALDISLTGNTGMGLPINEGQPTITVHDDGTFTIGWLQNHATGGTNNDIFLQTFAASPAAVTGDPGDQVTLPTFGFPGDRDGSEHVVSLTIHGLPEGFSLDVGHRIDSGDPASDWVIDRTDPDGESFLDAFPSGTSPLVLDTPAGHPVETTLQITMTTGEITDPAQTASVTVPVPIQIGTLINEAPVVDLDPYSPGNDAVATFTEGQGPAYLDYYATLDDDNTNWDGATLTVAINGGHPGEQLSIDSWGTGPGELLVDGSDLLYEGNVVGTISGGADGTPLTVTFNADACHCAVELTIASLMYDRTDDVTGAESRDISFTFVDGGGTDNGGHDTSVTHVALDVLPGASPPVVLPGGIASGDEDSVIALTGVSLSAGNVDPATGLVTVHLSVEHGTLTIDTGVAGGIDASAIIGGANGGHSLVLSGTLDQINATLAAANGLTYQGDHDYAGSDGLTIGAFDGNAASTIDFSSLGTQPVEGATAIAGGDIDNDGLGDLAFGLDGGILLLSAFPQALPMDGSASSIVFADANGDGIKDVVFTARETSESPGANHLGYIDGSTGDQVVIADMSVPTSLVVGDFDGNGLLDFAAGEFNEGNVGIVLQTAPGVYSPIAFTMPDADQLGDLVTGDFDGDGVLDLLLNHAGTQSGVDLMHGNGDGTFADAVRVADIPGYTVDLVTGDFNGDGITDAIVTSDDHSQAITVLIGDGAGGFTEGASYARLVAGSAPVAIQAGDLNGDGVLDLAVLNWGFPGTVAFLAGQGDGTFASAGSIDTVSQPGSLTFSDPDGDGDLDLVVAGATGIDAFNNDGTTRGTTEVKQIEVNAVNDAPVLGDPTFATVSIVASTGGAAPLMHGVTVSDAEAALGFVGGSVTLTVSGTGGGMGVNLGTHFRLSGTTLSDSAGHLLGTLTGSGTLSLTLTGLTSYATADVLETLFNSINFAALGHVLAPEVRTVTLTFNDGGNGGGTGLTDTVTQTLLIPFNKIDGTADGDDLLGTSWADELYGLAGNDGLTGGGGNDRLYGGLGDDMYFIDDAGDRAIENPNEGNDTVYSPFSYSLVGQAIETLILTGTADIYGRGNQLDNRIEGNSGINKLYGGLGNDTYVIQNSGDQVFENANEGTDTVLSSVSFSLAGQYVENLTFIGTANLSGTGNSLDNVMTGNSGINLLRGMAGDDTLDGGAGGDDLRGGTGDDHYIVDNALDQITELDGEGHDSVEASVTFSLAGQYVEDLTLTGHAAINGTGNSLDNALTGNDAANRLRGMDGNDTLSGGDGDDQLYGGPGNDMLTGGAGADSFFFDAAPGSGNIDTVTDFQAGVDHIYLDRMAFYLPLGTLSADAFVIGAAATDNHDRIIYDAATGWLSYDADGSGTAAAVHFATLQPGLALTAADFGVYL